MKRAYYSLIDIDDSLRIVCFEPTTKYLHDGIFATHAVAPACDPPVPINHVRGDPVAHARGPHISESRLLATAHVFAVRDVVLDVCAREMARDNDRPASFIASCCPGAHAHASRHISTCARAQDTPGHWCLKQSDDREDYGSNITQYAIGTRVCARVAHDYRACGAAVLGVHV